MLKKFTLILACAAFLSSPAPAQAKPAVAVYPTIVGPGAKSLVKRNFDVQSITRSLEEALRATRRFAVYERSAEILQESVLKEQDLAQSGMAASNAAEFGKLNNVALIVQPFVAEFRFGSSFAEVDGLPGKFRRTDSGKISVTFKVLDTTSGEIKYQVTSQSGFSGEPVVVDGRSGGPSASRWSKMVERVTLKGSNSIVNSVFPILVVKFQNDQIFLNRGEGNGIAVGNVMELFSAGEPLVDPATGETLGSSEFFAGKIKIVRVLPKFSVAEAVGNLEAQPQPGDIVR